MGAPALAIDGLERRFGSVRAVDGVSLEVREGELVGFLGANGAGKTTTLRCATGLLRPHAGSVTIAGHSLAREPLAARRAFGFVPDRPFLYERLSAREALAFLAALYDLPADRAAQRSETLIERLELADVADDLAETYSHGMRQKLALAMGLVHEPRLLLLDEPLVGLDPHGARALKDLLREHVASGGGVLVSTHLLEVAERLCDRVVILRRGRVVAEGTPDALRGARADATLEDVFLELTRADGEPPR